MSDVQEEIEDEVEEVSGIRAHLDDAIGSSEGSELDDFDTPLHEEFTEEENAKADEEINGEGPDIPEDVDELEDKSGTKIETSSTEKPPLDWGVEVREEWKNLPESVKAHLHARDKHVNTMLQDGAENRKAGEGLNNIANSYKAIMDAEGVSDPLAAVEGLFKSVGTLRMGTQAEKAQKIAQFVQLYGVDINALDNALVGNPVSEADPMAAMIDERMAPVNQLLEQMNQNKQSMAQQQQTDTNNNIAEFGKTAEFLEDVRDDMADLLQMAGKRGDTMTLQQAYDKACAINPQISNVMAKRASDATILGSQNNIAAKRNAASSISGNSGGHANANSSGGLRGALMNAFEDHA